MKNNLTEEQEGRISKKSIGALVRDAGQKVLLPVPFERDGELVESVYVRRPYAGELRGLNLGGVMELEFDTAQTLLPRVSDLTEREMINMEPENLVALMTTLTGFFVRVDKTPNK
ncbi:phage tail assembly protein [Vibrio scophthalmi]|uniref:Phage tail assembly protein n=1 Tax=Vibrio scophthalmi TaxID=45658 RepID=A0A1E3WJ29_9VIBR|nr:phage tail assembly protein [Vibrio scophthalmi]ODS09735.1 hypothetical protein VSF3289_03197 [Vibrio scophthalmi]